MLQDIYADNVVREAPTTTTFRPADRESQKDFITRVISDNFRPLLVLNVYVQQNEQEAPLIFYLIKTDGIKTTIVYPKPNRFGYHSDLVTYLSKINVFRIDIIEGNIITADIADQINAALQPRILPTEYDFVDMWDDLDWAYYEPGNDAPTNNTENPAGTYTPVPREKKGFFQSWSSNAATLLFAVLKNKFFPSWFVFVFIFVYRFVYDGNNVKKASISEVFADDKYGIVFVFFFVCLASFASTVNGMVHNLWARLKYRDFLNTHALAIAKLSFTPTTKEGSNQRSGWYLHVLAGVAHVEKSIPQRHLLKLVRICSLQLANIGAKCAIVAYIFSCNTSSDTAPRIAHYTGVGVLFFVTFASYSFQYTSYQLHLEKIYSKSALGFLSEEYGSPEQGQSDEDYCRDLKRKEANTRLLIMNDEINWTLVVSFVFATLFAVVGFWLHGMEDCWPPNLSFSPLLCFAVGQTRFTSAGAIICETFLFLIAIGSVPATPRTFTDAFSLKIAEAEMSVINIAKQLKLENPNVFLDEIYEELVTKYDKERCLHKVVTLVIFATLPLLWLWALFGLNGLLFWILLFFVGIIGVSLNLFTNKKIF